MFIHSPAEGHLLRCFQVLAVMNEFSFYKHLFDFPGGSNSRESTCNAGDLGLIPALGRSPGGGNATHSSILAWEIPWTEEPGRLQSMGSQRGKHDLATKQQQDFSEKHRHH